MTCGPQQHAFSDTSSHSGTSGLPRAARPATIFLVVLRDALASGAATLAPDPGLWRSTDGATETGLIPFPDTPPDTPVIGYRLSDGVALLPLAALTLVRARLAAQGKRWAYGRHAIGAGLVAGGYVVRRTIGQSTYRMRMGPRRASVWYVASSALGPMATPTVPADPLSGPVPVPSTLGVSASNRAAPVLPTAPEVDRRIAFLRTLARLEFMLGQYIHTLFFPTQHGSTMLRFLQRLLDDGLIWRSNVVPLRVPRDCPPLQRTFPQTGRYPYLYGLTEVGKTYLLTLGELEYAERHRVLKARDLASAPIRKDQTPHDVQVAWWCVSVLKELMRHPFCTSVFLELELTTATGQGGQRIDAFVIMRFSTSNPRSTVGTIPWYDYTPLRTDEVEVKLALEIDRGTEQGIYIYDKGVAYRDLTFDANGYTAMFGGPILPVFIVPTTARAVVIAQHFLAAWPQGRALITTAVSAVEKQHPEHGALWGKYLWLHDRTPAPLLTRMLVDLANGGRLAAVPAFSIEAWKAGLGGQG